jgi:transposase
VSGLFWLSDVQWAAIEPHLPMVYTGPRRVDDRRHHQRHRPTLS